MQKHRQELSRIKLVGMERPHFYPMQQPSHEARSPAAGSHMDGVKFYPLFDCYPIHLAMGWTMKCLREASRLSLSERIGRIS